MGRVKDNNISGAIGPVVFYTVRGQNFVRAKPKKRKKKPSGKMKLRLSLFGEITGPSSRMLKDIKDYLRFPVGFNDYNRLRGWMYILYSANHNKEHWDIAADNNICQLNPAIDLRHFFRPDIVVSQKGSNDILVQFPSFNPISAIRAPVDTNTIVIKVIVASSQPGLSPVNITHEIYRVNYADSIVPATEIVLKTRVAAGDIAIVALAIEYEKTGKIEPPDPRWLPAAVIAMGRINN